MQTSLSLVTGLFCQTATCHFIMFNGKLHGYYVTYHGKLHVKTSLNLDYISFQLISVLLETVSKKINSLLSWRSESWYLCMYLLNRFSKCQWQWFALLLLLQLVTMVSRIHSEFWRACKNKRFPAVKGFIRKNVILALSKLETITEWFKWNIFSNTYLWLNG